MPKGARPNLPRSNVTAQPQPELFDLYRTGFKSALDWMQTSLENAERLQKQQLTAFRSESAGALDTGRQKTERR